MDWDDLRIGLAISRAGSLSGAARVLKLNHATVWRRLKALEAKIAPGDLHPTPAQRVPSQCWLEMRVA